MKLNIFSKIAVGFATLIYVVLPILASGFFLFFIVILQSEPESRASFGAYFQLGVLTLSCFLFLLQVGLMVFYIIHIFKNKSIMDSLRVISVLGIVFFPMIGMPIYYFLYVWRDRLPVASSLSS